jgi:hypothetical protein
MSRRYINYKGFKHLKQGFDDREMDEICRSSGGFKLQAQQVFLKEYITKHPEWKSLLLYHQIGSGKTCTAITLAEQYTDLNPRAKVTVILPARLRTNFLDELMSPCGMERYISKDDFARYMKSATSQAEKARIRSAFMRAVGEKYEILSFERFKKMAGEAANLKQWVASFTKNRLVIVDEVHNLISNDYDNSGYKKIVETHKLMRAKGGNAILFKYMNKFADASCKMIYLTATPIFNHIGQFKELVSIMRPDAEVKKGMDIQELINLLRGRVSFFPGTSPNAYPNVVYRTADIPLSETQDEVINKIIESGSDELSELKEAFMSHQRMASIACLPGWHKVTDKNMDRILNNLPEYAPKVNELMKRIAANRGKHLVYSTFVAGALRIVEAALRKRGWISWKEAANDKALQKKHIFKVYALWDGSVRDEDKLAIKSIANNKLNMRGSKIRVILGSPSVKEGVSFKHIQHLHVLDPLWNMSAMMQVEGRAIRFCSHVDIPKDDKQLKRQVVVHYYKSIPMHDQDERLVDETADQLIYDTIIPRKKKSVQAAEAVLKTVSIDYHLFKRMHENARAPSPKTPVSSPSPVDVPTDDIRVLGPKSNKTKEKKTTCPKPRRPDSDGKCRDGFVMKLNKHKDECCYKVRVTKEKAAVKPNVKQNVKPKKTAKASEPKEVSNKTTTKKVKVQLKSKAKPEAEKVASPVSKTCPKPRRPDAKGKCPSGYEKQKNKHGEDCCYKTSRSR